MVSLPIEEVWFRKLISFSILIGFVGGACALFYTAVTATPIDWIFGPPLNGLLAGSWWWILITAIGGALVVYFRKRWKIPDDLPGAIEIGQRAIIDIKDVPKLVFISVISLVFGASLGPSYGIVTLGGGFGSYVYHRLKLQSRNKDVEKEFTRTGMSSSLGSVFTDPLLGTLFTVELSPSKKNQLASSLPQLIAASLGFLLFYGVTGTTIQKLYLLPEYDFNQVHLLLGAVLGVTSVLVLMLFALIGIVAKKLMALLGNGYIKGIVGGGLVGLLSFVVPLTFGSGNSQLNFATTEFASFSTGFLLLVFVIKMFSISISQSSGFLGGNVFPTLFIGGISGMFIHSLFPSIPPALSVSAMMAAVPGATLSTPLSIILVAILGVGVGTNQIPPVIIAVVVAQLTLVALRYLKKRKQIIKA